MAEKQLKKREEFFGSIDSTSGMGNPSARLRGAIPVRRQGSAEQNSQAEEKKDASVFYGQNTLKEGTDKSEERGGRGPSATPVISEMTNFGDDLLRSIMRPVADSLRKTAGRIQNRK